MGIYSALEEKFYGMIDWFDSKGIKFSKATDFLDAKGIPAFPVFLLFIILLIVGGYFGYQYFFNQNYSLTVLVRENGKNPLENVVVKVNGDDYSQTLTTNSDGKAVFSVPKNKLLEITANKSPFEEAKQSFTAEKNDEIEISLSSQKNTISKTIQLLNKDSSQLFSKEIELRFSCSGNRDFSQTKKTANGEIKLDIPKDCGNLIPSIPNSIGISIAEGTTIRLEESDSKILLSETPGETGSVTVFAKDSEEKPLTDAGITLVSESGNQLGPKSTINGSTSFEGVLPGKYYVIAYDKVLGTIDSSLAEEKFFEVLTGKRSEYKVVFSKPVVGTIKVIVKSKNNNAPIQKAKATLFKNEAKVMTAETNTEGRARFSVSENIPYSITIEHAQFQTMTKPSVTISETELEFLLTESSQANSGRIVFEALDEIGNPVEDAKLRLLKAGDATVLGETITNMNGIGVFERIEPGSYLVKIIKPGIGEKVSNVIRIEAGKETKAAEQLSIGFGSIEISLFDKNKNPVSSAIIKAIENSTGTQLAEETIGAEAKKNLSVRADKTFFIQVESEEFANHYSIPMKIIKGQTKKLELILEEKPGKLEAEFLGIFNGKEQVIDSIAAGQKYTAKIRLKIPEEKNYSTAGIHFRTGLNENSIVEKDQMQISEVKAAQGIIRKGKSYNPSLGYAIDLQQLTQTNAKWIEATIKNPSAGVHEIEAEIQTKSNAELSSALEFNYRAFGIIGNRFERNPIDNTLRENENSIQKQALYAFTFTQDYFIGPTNLCAEGFCYTISIQNLSTNEQSSILDEYSTAVFTKNKLFFSITNNQQIGIEQPKIRIKSENGIELGKYEINTIGGAKKSGETKNNLAIIDSDNFLPNTNISGNIEFVTNKDGASKIELEIIGKENKFKKTIFVKIRPSKEFQLSIIPKTIIPFVENKLLIITTDKNTPIENTGITIKKDGAILTTGATDSEGIFAINLPAQNPNTIIEIIAEKQDYKTIINQTKISGNLLTSNPASIKEKFVVTGADAIQETITLTNNTLIPLTIKNAKTGSELEEFAKTTIILPANQTINPDAIIEMPIEIKLTEKAKQITNPIAINSSLLITTIGLTDKKEFLTSIPIEIRIGFGKETDEKDCLTLSQAEWKINTGKQPKTITITLKNNCKVEENPIALQNISARIMKTNDNLLGSYSITSNLENSAQLKLSEKFETIALFMKENNEAELTITFSPEDIGSGNAKQKIEIRGINQTENKSEEIKTSLQTETIINDLTECITVTQQRQLLIQTCPTNLGYGQYPNYFSQNNNPYNPYSYNPINQYTPTGILPSPYSAYSSYPYSNYREPMYDGRSYNPNQQNIFDNQFYCGKGEFKILNSCSSEVKIDLDASSAINISNGTSFDLKPNEDKTISVEAGYRIGRYPIEIKAKTKDSTEKPILANTVFALIQSMSEVNFDCITIEPNNKFQFQSFIGKPMHGKIFNNCFDIGVRLVDSTQSPISIVKSLSYTELFGPAQSQAITAQQLLQQQLLQQSSGAAQAFEKADMVKTIRVLPKTLKPGSDNRMIEEMPFQIIPDVRYRESLPELSKKGMPFQIIGNMRYFFTAAYYRVEELADIYVKYSNQMNTVSTKQFPVILEDIWAIGETIDALNTTGNPARAAKECIREEELDFGTQNIAKEETIELEKNSDYKKWLVILDDDYCGNQDKLEFGINPTQFKEEKYNLKFELTRDSHNVKTIITATDNIPEEGINITKEISMRLIRPVTAAKVQQKYDFTTAFKVKLMPKKAVKTEAEQAKCETGENALQEYGFDKLLWTWNFESIGKENNWDCDEQGGKKYCDAVQFGLEASKKNTILKETMNKLGITDSTKILETVMETTKIIDEGQTPTKELEFYLNKSGRITEKDKIDSSKYPELASLAATIKGIELKDQATAENIIPKTNELLQILKTKDYSENIIAEIDSDKISGANKIKLEEIGADKIPNTNYYVLTLKEFAYFHNEVYKTPECKDRADCIINQLKQTTIAGDNDKTQTTITVDFLKELYNAIEFKIGFLTTDSLTIEEKEKIATYGKTKTTPTNIEDSLPMEYKPFGIFYTRIISFNAFLKQDAFSNDYANDMKEYYGEKISNNTLFQTNQTLRESAEKGFKVSAGKYHIELQYAKASATAATAPNTGTAPNELFTIIFSNKTEPTEKEKLNPLLFIPFDGEVGKTKDSKLERIDYGVSYSKEWENIAIAENTTEKEKIVPMLPTDKDKALVKLDSTALEAISNGAIITEFNQETIKGTIAKISKSALNFSNTKPIPLKLAITNLADKKGAKAAYKLSATEKGYTETNDVKNDKAWIEWESACSTMQGKDFQNQTWTQPRTDQKIRDKRGFEWKEPTTQTGTLALKAIAVMPKTNGFLLGSLEARKTAELECLSCTNKQKISTETNQAEAIQLIPNEEVGQETTIPAELEKIRKEEACVNSSNNTLTLSYNKEHYFKELGIKCE